MLLIRLLSHYLDMAGAPQDTGPLKESARQATSDPTPGGTSSNSPVRTDLTADAKLKQHTLCACNDDLRLDDETCHYDLSSLEAWVSFRSSYKCSIHRMLVCFP